MWLLEDVLKLSTFKDGQDVTASLDEHSWSSGLDAELWDTNVSGLSSVLQMVRFFLEASVGH